MQQVNPARVLSTLSNVTDWEHLLCGEVDAIRLEAFATPAECAQLVAFMTSHPATVAYTYAAGITRLGGSLSEALRVGVRGYYAQQRDIVREALLVNSVASRILGTIAASWPYGAETFVYQNIPLGRGILRRFGNGTEIHDDDINKEIPGDVIASTVTSQIGVNFYAEVPENGGELEGWRKRLTREEQEPLRNSDPNLSYGLRRDAMGSPDWEIRPKLADLVLFRNSEPHSVRPGDGPRTTWGFFLGYRGEHKPFLVWS